MSDIGTTITSARAWTLSRLNIKSSGQNSHNNQHMLIKH